MFLLKVFGFFTIVTIVLCENVTFKSCPNYVGNCAIHAVRIDPCPEAASDQACKIKRGSSAEIEFDYTPDFDADKVEGRVYWASEIDLPLLGMDTDGCKYTTCPVVKDKKQTFKFTLPIQKKFPANTYEIKWRVTGNTGQECCFLTSIQLTKN